MENISKCKNNVCVGLLAHVDAGKTTLSEGLLYAAGKIRHLGRVDAGDAFLDTYDLERERGITIFSKQALLTLDGMNITLLDTPGHVDFSAEITGTGLRDSCYQWRGRCSGAYRDTLETSVALSDSCFYICK